MSRALAILLFTLLGVPAWGAELRFTWDPNSEADLAGYRFYTMDGDISLGVVDVGNVIQWTATGLEPGHRYSFYVTAYNASGLESEPSNIVVVTVPNPTRPAPPADLQLIP